MDTGGRSREQRCHADHIRLAEGRLSHLDGEEMDKSINPGGAPESVSPGADHVDWSGQGEIVTKTKKIEGQNNLDII